MEEKQQGGVPAIYEYMRLYPGVTRWLYVELFRKPEEVTGVMFEASNDYHFILFFRDKTFAVKTFTREEAYET